MIRWRVLLLVTLGLAFRVSDGFAQTQTPANVTSSIQRGVDWLLEQPAFRRKDVIVFSYWMYQDLDILKIKGADRLLQKAQAAFSGRRKDDPMLRNILGGEKRLPDDVADEWVAFQRQDLTQRLKDGRLGISAGGTQDFLLISLYASDPRVRGQFDNIFQALFTHELDRYGTTHQLMALHFLRPHNVFPLKTLDAVIKKHADRMLIELDQYIAQGQFIDLLAEQMAFLGLVKRYRDLSEPRVQFLLKHQNASGYWQQPKSESSAHSQIDYDQHATVLAIYALVAYARHHEAAL